MYSKMQKRLAAGLNGLMLSTPLSVMMTISPGSMSRTTRAPMMSNATVSDARIIAPSSCPSTSGRTPKGSRTPMSASLVSATSE